MLLLDLIMLVASVETVDVANVPTPRATVTANLNMTCMFGSSLSGDIATIVEFQRARATYASANRGQAGPQMPPTMTRRVVRAVMKCAARFDSPRASRSFRKVVNEGRC
jgi:hypothetical protein